jgi:hypothetical protein
MRRCLWVMKRTQVLALVLLIGLLALTGGCRHSDSSDNGGSVSGVVFAGFYDNGSRDMACYWDGTTLVDFDNTGTESSAAVSPVVVSGGTVYAAGVFSDGEHTMPCVWAGDTRTDLDVPETATDGYATAVAVYNGTVYTSGYYIEGSDLFACYWVGDTIHYLPTEGSDLAIAFGIAVDDGTVYTCGFYRDNFDNDIACCWTDDDTITGLIDPDDSSYSYAFGITLDAEGEVYICGYYTYNDTNEIACYWVDGEKVDLTMETPYDVANAYGIAVGDGGTVYTCGFVNDGEDNLACYWAGTEITLLSEGLSVDACAYAITLSDSVVYTGGYYDSETGTTAGAWADDTLVDLGMAGYEDSSISCGYRWWQFL